MLIFEKIKFWRYKAYRLTVKGIKMIEMNKKYKTKTGLSVRILCTDLQDKNYPIIAAIMQDNEEIVVSFTETGKFIENKEYGLDLIEVTPYDDFKVDDLCVVWDESCHPVFRYFGMEVSGMAYCFEDGKTSFTATKDALLSWDFCRKATEEEIKTKTIKD